MTRALLAAGQLALFALFVCAIAAVLVTYVRSFTTPAVDDDLAEDDDSPELPPGA